MKIFITGADGFIGSHLTEALVRAGHTVNSLVLYNSLGTKGWLDFMDPEISDSVQIAIQFFI